MTSEQYGVAAAQISILRYFLNDQAFCQWMNRDLKRTVRMDLSVNLGRDDRGRGKKTYIIMPGLTVHHLRYSGSERVVWLCEELEIPYRLKLYNRTIDGDAPPEYKTIHWTGTAPVIEDESPYGGGMIVLAETAAIFDYILSRYGQGRLVVGADDPAYPDYLFWLHYSHNTFQQAALQKLHDQMQGVTEANQLTEGQDKRLKNGLKQMASRLSSYDYLGGNNFTTADITMFYTLTTGRLFSRFGFNQHAALVHYTERLGSRQAYIRTQEKTERAFETGALDPRTPPNRF
ncbi:hypothetical protein KEM54_005806 [Ascosphaera aggregata]|nr:hypothetical protein KEM54_005806 [Ascosphaera aggregata]